MFLSGATATAARYKAVGELIVPGAGNAPDSDSFDGTGFSMFPDINIPKGLGWIERAEHQTQGQLL
jgi:hypothetical protein